MIDFDIVLEHVGGTGWYQVLLCFIASYYSITAGMGSIAPVFINYRPDYRCNVPPIDNSTLYPNLTEAEILNLTTPYDSESMEYDTCYRYGYNLTACDASYETCVNKSADAIKCDKGYYYDDSLFKQTVVTEFDLVCDRNYLDPLATSLYLAGILIGSLVFGDFTDRWGRRKVYIGCGLLGFTALLSCSFVHNYWLFVTCRVAAGFFGSGSYLSCFVFVMEITSRQWRSWMGLGYTIMFALGYMLYSGLAYQWRSWHSSNLAAALISIPYVIFALIIPESPRWLFTVGKEEEGKKIARTFAKYNKITLEEPEVWKKAEQDENLEVTENKRNLFDLFRTAGIRIITIKLLFLWFVNSIVYYGISLNAGALDGDIFLNNTLNGLMELGSYITVAILLDRVGRRYLKICMLGIAGIGLLCSTATKELATSDGVETVSVVFAFIAKVGISGSYGVLYNYTTELYPTVLRANGNGVCGISAGIGSIIAPFVIALQNSISWLPNVIFGILSMIAMVVVFTIPETNEVNMLETIEEAEEFYKGKVKQRMESTAL